MKDICKHYKIFGVNECRKIPNTVNVNFSYVKNNKLSGQIKWYNCLNEIKNKYENFIITNDSFILINSLVPFINYCKTSNKDLIGLLDSYELKYHYPDFLRYYNRTGINKWLNFFESIKDKIDCQYDLIKKIEIESTFITDSKECFYKMDENFNKNLHFVDIVNKYFINKMKYPVIKIKKINFTKYESKDLPADFNHLEYRSLHNDLSKMDRNQLIDHFLNAGISEGRTYKKNQKKKMPDYIRSKIKGILNI